MSQEHKQVRKRGSSLKRHRVLHKLLISLLALVVLAGVIGTGILIYNNISVISDEAFAKKVDTAIERGLDWTKVHTVEIMERRNAALMQMLNECDQLKATDVFAHIVDGFMSTPGRPRCWYRLIDPNWPVDELELNLTIKKEYLDNKWLLYALAPDKAKITPEEMYLFEPDRWQRRKLTHQLYALMMLRKTNEPNEELDNLIDHLCDRLTSELVFDVAVVDIYIQKVTFVLWAGCPGKIRRRWIERIIANQLPDGGWNDRKFCFISDSRKPVFDLDVPPSNQHATVQALTALYMVRYRYPEHFGLK